MGRFSSSLTEHLFVEYVRAYTLTPLREHMFHIAIAHIHSIRTDNIRIVASTVKILTAGFQPVNDDDVVVTSLRTAYYYDWHRQEAHVLHSVIFFPAQAHPSPLHDPVNYCFRFHSAPLLAARRFSNKKRQHACWQPVCTRQTSSRQVDYFAICILNRASVVADVA